MRTTIDVPEALAREVQSLAIAAGMTLSELAASGLRRELAERQRAGRQGFTFPTASGAGLVAEMRTTQTISASYGAPSLPAG